MDVEYALSECTAMKNNRVHHGGFTPSQWVLGGLPDEIDSLTSEGREARLGQHQEILDGATEFAKKMTIRAAAREAFSQVDSSQRIRAAMLRKSTPQRGALCCRRPRLFLPKGWP